MKSRADEHAQNSAILVIRLRHSRPSLAFVTRELVIFLKNGLWNASSNKRNHHQMNSFTQGSLFHLGCRSLSRGFSVREGAKFHAISRINKIVVCLSELFIQVPLHRKPLIATLAGRKSMSNSAPLFFSLS